MRTAETSSGGFLMRRSDHSPKTSGGDAGEQPVQQQTEPDDFNMRVHTERDEAEFQDDDEDLERLSDYDGNNLSM